MGRLTTKKLQNYVDGELSKSEDQGVKRELEGDLEAQKAVSNLKRVDGLVQEYLEERVEEYPPADMWEAVSKRIKEDPAPGWWQKWQDRFLLADRRPLVPVLAAGGAAVAILLVALWVFVWSPSTPGRDANKKGKGPGNRLVVESMEYGGPPPMLFQIEDTEGQGPTTVIWVNPDSEGTGDGDSGGETNEPNGSSDDSI